MLTLTLEERGAYNTLLDLIYDRSGPIPDDARWLAGWMGVSARRWLSIRAALIVKAKIYAVNVNGVDCLMNERAAKEIENQSEISRKSRETGAKGGRKRAENAANSNKINEYDQGPPQATLKLKTETGTIGSVSKDTGGEPRTISQKAWDQAKGVLVAQGGMTTDSAGKFFGKLLAEYKLEAGDLYGAIAEAEHNRTADPQGWLTKAAQARSRRRSAPGPAKRVGFV